MEKRNFSCTLGHSTDATSQRHNKHWIKRLVFTLRDVAPRHGNLETVITSIWKLWYKWRIYRLHHRH